MKQLPLRGGGYALVDDEDFERVNKYTWYLDVRSGYACRHTTLQNPRRTVTIWLHRDVMNAPTHKQVDHKDGVPLNCQKYNLRFSTQSQNRMNSRKMKGCRSIYKGVRRHKRGRWYARIRSRPGDRQKEKWLGTFENEHLAAVMYDFWALEIFGEFARTNFKVVKWG